MDADTGKVRWRVRIGPERVVAARGRQARLRRRLDAARSTRFEHANRPHRLELPAPATRSRAGSAYAGGTVCSSAPTTITSTRSTRGRASSSGGPPRRTGSAASGTFYSTPAVAYGRVYIGSTDGKVYSFGASSGEAALVARRPAATSTARRRSGTSASTSAPTTSYFYVLRRGHGRRPLAAQGERPDLRLRGRDQRRRLLLDASRAAPTRPTRAPASCSGTSGAASTAPVVDRSGVALPRGLRAGLRDGAEGARVESRRADEHFDRTTSEGARPARSRRRAGGRSAAATGTRSCCAGGCPPRGSSPGLAIGYLVSVGGRPGLHGEGDDLPRPAALARAAPPRFRARRPNPSTVRHDHPQRGGAAGGSAPGRDAGLEAARARLVADRLRLADQARRRHRSCGSPSRGGAPREDRRSPPTRSPGSSIKDTSGYVAIKIATLKSQLANYAQTLAGIDRQLPALRRAAVLREHRPRARPRARAQLADPAAEPGRAVAGHGPAAPLGRADRREGPDDRPRRADEDDGAEPAQLGASSAALIGLLIGIAAALLWEPVGRIARRSA